VEKIENTENLALVLMMPRDEKLLALERVGTVLWPFFKKKILF
jgi:hypothetical protein